MVAVTTRTGKGAPLTTAEMDANWNAIVADLNTKVTQAQARAAISVTGSLTYNSSTGVLGFTETPLTLSTIVAALGYTPLSNTGGTISGSLNVTSTLQQGGNQVLHAGNYNSYSPTLTGGGASGTWGISISGNSAYASSAGNADTLDSLHASSFLRSDTSNTMFSGQGSALAFENQGSFFRFAFNEVRFYDWQAGTDIFILNDSVYSSRNIRTASRIVVGEGQSSSWLEMYDDESPNGKKYLHANSNLIGFVGGDGNWKAYVREDGHFWTAAYGWLNDYFFRSVSNCAGQLDQVNENCYNCGNIFQGSRNELIDEGGNLRIRRIGTYVNCNCNCACK